MRLSYLLLIAFIGMYSCNSPKCYNIREWKGQSLDGKKFNYTDTLELSKEPLNKDLLDTLVNMNGSNYFRINKSVFSIEATNTLVLGKDTIKVVRVLKDGNLTFFYTKQYGVLMTFSRLKREELIKIENTCTKRVTIMSDINKTILYDTVLNPKIEPKF